MTLRRLLGSLLVLSLLFAACGDDGASDDQAASQDDSSNSDSNDPSSGDAGGSSDDGSSDTTIDLGVIPDGLVPDGCEFFINFGAAISLAISGQSDLSSFESSDAPEEIRDEVGTVLDAFAEVSSSPGAASQAFSDPEVEDALNKIDAFAADNCTALGD